MDSTQLQIVPLALIMVMGPQILTAIFLVTSREPVKNSVAMLIGVVLAAAVSILVWFGLYEALGIKQPSGSGPSTADYVVAGLLALAGIHVFLGRHHASVPKWMSALQQAEPKRAFSLGFLLILLMPTDIVAVIIHGPLAPRQPRRRPACLAAPGRRHAADGPADPRLPAPRSPGPQRDARDPRLADHECWLVNIIVIVYFIYQLVK